VQRIVHLIEFWLQGIEDKPCVGRRLSIVNLKSCSANIGTGASGMFWPVARFLSKDLAFPELKIVASGKNQSGRKALLACERWS
jgi:hypothetical protein